jgi:hypothetical protein
VLNLGLRWDAETNMINNDYRTPQALADSLRGPLASQLFVRQTIPNPANPAGSSTQNVRTIDQLGGIENFISTGENRPIYKKAFQPRLGASFDVFLVKNDLVPPSTEQYSAGLRQTVGPALVTLTYNGVRGRNYMNFIRGAYTIGTPGAARQNYAAVFLTDDRVRTWYDAVQVQVEKPLLGTVRWGGSVAYTLGRSEEQGQSTDLFWGFDERYPTVADRPRLRAPGDQRHKIVANGVFRIPGDLVFSSIVNLATGITVNATDQTEGTGQFQQRTYTFTPGGRPFLGLGHVFAFQQVDMRLEKALRFAAGQNVSVVADLFNAFNNANYGCFNTTIPVRGQTNPNYGTPGCAGLGTRLQLGLRYGFRGTEAGVSGGR